MKRNSQHRNPLTILLLPFLIAGAAQSADFGLKLSPTPKWTNSVQLKEIWGKMSLAELRTNAEHGIPEAEHYLGWLYDTGVGIPRDPAGAASWYRKAADQGFALAENNLGVYYENGYGVGKDLGEALKWYRLAANQGLPAALNNLGRLSYNQGAPGLQRGDARRYYEESAERGDGVAAVNLGMYFLRVEYNADAVIYWFTVAAERGVPVAYNNLGSIYQFGSLLPRDYGEAHRWFDKGAALGEPRCELGLATLELEEHRSSPDLALVRKWELKAADQKLTDAYFQLGRLSELRDINHGPDFRPDYAEAAKWYQLAADAGDANASARLAELTARGHIGSSQDVIARLQRAADQGDKPSRLDLAVRYLKGEGKPRSPSEEPFVTITNLAEAQFGPAQVVLADFYRTGQHVQKDPIRAIFLLRKAAWGGNQDALARLEDLYEAMQEKRSPASDNQGLEKVFPIYYEALYSERADLRARIAHNYMDGTYPRDDVEAYAWLALAGQHGDAAARAESDKLFKTFDEATKVQAQGHAELLQIDAGQPLGNHL